MFVCMNSYLIILLLHRFNVIPDKAFLSGSFRSFEEGLSHEFKEHVIKALEELKEERKITYELQWNIAFPLLVNHEKEASHVERVGKKYFGEGKVGKGCLPVKASEDYAFYLKKVPGTFFYLGSGRGVENEITLHDSHFDFNDELIGPAAGFWLELVKDRLLSEH